MANFQLQDDQNVDVAIGLADDVGNAVADSSLDAGSVTATVSDATVLSATVSADQSSVNVKALGPVGAGETVTVTGSVNGTALPSAVLTIDDTASAPTAISLTPGTPVHN